MTDQAGWRREREGERERGRRGKKFVTLLEEEEGAKKRGMEERERGEPRGGM